jgi:hypothetical protein
VYQAKGRRQDGPYRHWWKGISEDSWLTNKQQTAQADDMSPPRTAFDSVKARQAARGMRGKRERKGGAQRISHLTRSDHLLQA